MLPQSLKVFKARSVQIPILPNVPTSLQTLDLAGNKQLLSVPDLSIATGLQELRLRGSPAIDDLPHGPPNLHLLQHLTQLVLTDCEVLVQVWKHIRKSPASITVGNLCRGCVACDCSWLPDTMVWLMAEVCAAGELSWCDMYLYM